MPNTETRDDMERKLRMAARALPRHRLGTAFGHVSTRFSDAAFLVCASKALNTITSQDAGSLVAYDGDMPDGVLGEVRLHREIYNRRRDVGAIVRTFAPDVVTLSAMGLTPRVRHGFGSYFAPAPPLWPETALLRDDAKAAEAAELMAEAPAIVLRGNGCVVAGRTIEEALALTWFLEMAATTELAFRAGGDASLDREYTNDQALARAVTSGGIVERTWAYLTHGDPESEIPAD
jgi:HCOMODA/2-hydroxy-3-carboxy-muconic semialdehyde decarboxylase